MENRVQCPYCENWTERPNQTNQEVADAPCASLVKCPNCEQWAWDEGHTWEPFGQEEVTA